MEHLCLIWMVFAKHTSVFSSGCNSALLRDELALANSSGKGKNSGFSKGKSVQIVGNAQIKNCVFWGNLETFTALEWDILSFPSITWEQGWVGAGGQKEKGVK